MLTARDIERVLDPAERNALLLWRRYGDETAVGHALSGAPPPPRKADGFPAFRVPGATSERVVRRLLESARGKIERAAKAKAHHAAAEAKTQANRRRAMSARDSSRAVEPAEPEEARPESDGPAPTGWATGAAASARERREQIRAELAERVGPLLAELEQVEGVLELLTGERPEPLADLGQGLIRTAIAPPPPPAERAAAEPAAPEPAAAPAPEPAPEEPAPDREQHAPRPPAGDLSEVPEELRRFPAAKAGGPIPQRVSAAENQRTVYRDIEGAGEASVPGIAGRTGFPAARVGRYLTDLAEAGLLRPLGRTIDKAPAYAIGDGTPFTELPAELADMPSAQGDGRLAIQFVTASEEKRVLDYVDGRHNVVSGEAIEALGLERSHAAAVLNALANHSLIRRTGRKRRAAGQERGREAIEFGPLTRPRLGEEAPPPPRAPSGDTPDLSEVRAKVAELGIFTPKRLAGEWGLESVRLSAHMRSMRDDEFVNRYGGERGPNVFYTHKDYAGPVDLDLARGTATLVPESEPPEPEAESRGGAAVAERARERDEAALAVIAERGPISGADVREATGIPEGSWPTVKERLVTRYGVAETPAERGVSPAMYSTATQAVEAPDSRTDDRPAQYLPSLTPTLEEARDDAVKRDAPFSPAQLVDAHEDWDLEVTEGRLRELAENGVLNDDSPTPDMPLFTYAKPSGPGRAAEMDRERREQDAPGGNGGGAPVPGTGHQQTPTNADVRQLIADCRRLGAECKVAGSGHWEVKVPGGRRVLVSATPRSRATVKSDRTRVRRAGLAV